MKILPVVVKIPIVWVLIGVAIIWCAIAAVIRR